MKTALKILVLAALALIPVTAAYAADDTTVVVEIHDVATDDQLADTGTPVAALVVIGASLIVLGALGAAVRRGGRENRS